MLLGRDPALSRLARFVATVRAGSGEALVIKGPAGIGKTTLLARAERPGLRALRARGLQGPSTVAFSGLLELLQPVLSVIGELPDRSRQALLGCLGLEPNPADPTGSAVALAVLLSRLASTAPVLCLVDDAHWLDDSSAAALLSAVRWRPERVGFLFAIRDEDPTDFDAAWLPSLTLGPLSDADSARLITGTWPLLSAPVVARLIAASEGNPLALEEFAGIAADQPDRLHEFEPLAVGSSLAAAFTERARRLSQPTQGALLVLAATDVAEFGWLSGVLHDVVGDSYALDEAADAGLVRFRDDRVYFCHPLVRSAVYHSASQRHRRSAHRALARALAERDPVSASWHRAACVDGPDETVAADLERTAAAAAARGGRAVQARALEQSAQLTPDGRTAVRRLLGAASAWLSAGQHDRAERVLIDVARRATEPEVRADAEHLRAQLSFWRDGRIPATLVGAARDVRARDPLRSAELLSFQLVEYVSDYRIDLARPLIDEAVSLVGERVDSPQVAWRLSIAMLLAGQTERGTALAGRLAAVAEQRGDIVAMLNVAQPLAIVERFGDARRLLDRAEQRLRADGDFWMLGHALVYRAQLEHYTGSFSVARMAAAEALSLADQLDQPMQQAEACMQLALAEARLGDEAGVREHAGRARRLATERARGTGELMAVSAAALGGAALTAGRGAEAVQHLEPAVSLVLEGGVLEPAAVPGLPDLIEAYALVGRTDDARRLLEVLATQASVCVRRWARLAAARCRLLVGVTDGVDELRAALDQDDGAARFVSARAWLTLGTELARHGRRSEAREALHRALAVFGSCSATPWTERAGEQLRALGEDVQAPARAVLIALSPRETRVAQLVATGARNQDIAATLFVTEKTVEAHLTAVYRKTGTRSRTQLVNLMAATR